VLLFLSFDPIEVCLISFDHYSSYFRVVSQLYDTFGENRFNEVRILNETGDVAETSVVNHKWLEVELPAGTGATLQLTMDRYVNLPFYDMPWADQEKNVYLKGKNLI
jgi:hypothetical protein